MPLMEVDIVHMDTTMQPLWCHDPFMALAMVCGLLVDGLQNSMIGLVDNKVVNKAMGFKAERLPMVQSVALSEE